MDPTLLDPIAKTLQRAETILFVTGAGLSADSGLPTYRGVGGLYEDADTPSGLSIEQVLSGPMLRQDPALCWQHIAQIEAACRGATPNRGHEVIAALADRADVTVLTQNVDGLHRVAGSQDVIEIHGHIHTLLCTQCSWRSEVPSYEGLQIPPACPDCGALVRPAVVLFEEALPPDAVERLQAAIASEPDLVVSVGTSSQFPYIAWPVLQQLERGRPALEINPGETSLSAVVPWHVQAGAAQTLGALWRRLEDT